MVILPRGKFMMGTETGEEVKLSSALGEGMTYVDTLEEDPAHLVVIDYDFALARFCVTFDEYDAYARATGAQLPDDDEGVRGSLPVVNVTWQQAKCYTNYLAEVTGKPYRLPSESEWEYAARAGTTTNYWWGDRPDIGKVNYNLSSRRGPIAVNSLEPNPWGLYNMHGNVSEWVEDCFHDSYYDAPSDGSAWITDYSWTDATEKDWVRVLRGGDYISNANEIRSSYRGRMISSDALFCIGFRVALTLA